VVSAIMTLAVVVGVLSFAAPLVTWAQAVKVWRIGLLTPGVVDPGSPAIAAFRQRLRELGYVEGQNRTLEFRSSGGRVERYREVATELAGL
jgi:putative ABC transport system substrate-binding protein